MAFANVLEKLTGIGFTGREETIDGEDYRSQDYDDSRVEDTLRSDDYDDDDYDYDDPPRARSGFFSNFWRSDRDRGRNRVAESEDMVEEDEPMREREYTPRSRYSRTGSYGTANSYESYTEERPGSPVQLVLIRAHKFNEVERIAENLRQRRSIIVNFEEVQKDEAQRILDFLSGTTYAMKGSIQKVSKCTFVFAVGQVDLMGRIEETSRTEEGSFSLFGN